MTTNGAMYQDWPRVYQVTLHDGRSWLYVNRRLANDFDKLLLSGEFSVAGKTHRENIVLTEKTASVEDVSDQICRECNPMWVDFHLVGECYGSRGNSIDRSSVSSSPHTS